MEYTGCLLLSLVQRCTYYVTAHKWHFHICIGHNPVLHVNCGSLIRYSTPIMTSSTISATIKLCNMAAFPLTISHVTLPRAWVSSPVAVRNFVKSWNVMRPYPQSRERYSYSWLFVIWRLQGICMWEPACALFDWLALV